MKKIYNSENILENLELLQVICEMTKDFDDDLIWVDIWHSGEIVRSLRMDKDWFLDMRKFYGLQDYVDHMWGTTPITMSVKLDTRYHDIEVDFRY